MDKSFRFTIFAFIFSTNLLLAMELSPKDYEKKENVHRCSSCNRELLFNMEQVEQEGICRLPKVILTMFIEDIPTALAVSATSKHMYNICQNPALWRFFIKESTFIDPSVCVKEQVVSLCKFFERKLLFFSHKEKLELLDTIKPGELGFFVTESYTWDRLYYKVHNKIPIEISRSALSSKCFDTVAKTLAFGDNDYRKRLPERLTQEDLINLRNNILLRYSPPYTFKIVINNIDYVAPYVECRLMDIGMAISGKKDDKNKYDLVLGFPYSKSSHTTIVQRWTNFSLYECSYNTEGEEDNTSLGDKINDYNISKIQEIYIELYNKGNGWFPSYKIQEYFRDH